MLSVMSAFSASEAVTVVLLAQQSGQVPSLEPPVIKSNVNEVIVHVVVPEGQGCAGLPGNPTSPALYLIFLS
jgi:hypothetical protein